MLSTTITTTSSPANAEVGDLPEYSDTNFLLNGITVNVIDEAQLDSTIEFFVQGFEFEIIRKRKVGSVTDVWLGFGPDGLRFGGGIPRDFVVGLSSLGAYGGHATIHVRYDSKDVDVLYRMGENEAPGDNIAFVQVSVPNYRISKMIKNQGYITDAYGCVSVISPCGIPVRGIIGRVPDPVMFVAINCIDIEQSNNFYSELGFVEQEYPYARPSNGMGQFEPMQPPDSIYLAPNPNSMGVLLIPPEKKKRNKKNKNAQRIKPNPVLRSLNIVYTPSGDGGALEALDPQGVPILFVPIDAFENEVSSTS